MLHLGYDSLQAILQRRAVLGEADIDGETFAHKTIGVAERAVKTGNKDYARQILLLLKDRVVSYDPDAYKALISQVDKLLAEL